MADLINLNKARKARAKAEREAAVVENRARFGRAKGEKTLAEARREKAARELDGRKRD
ncbi:MAG TPA: DUF4169 family protein [Caulobacteraceae bacterium]|jgi:hypothetical protein